jgi:hypothetical protein
MTPQPAGSGGALATLTALWYRNQNGTRRTHTGLNHCCRNCRNFQSLTTKGKPKHGPHTPLALRFHTPAAHISHPSSVMLPCSSHRRAAALTNSKAVNDIQGCPGRAQDPRQSQPDPVPAPPHLNTPASSNAAANKRPARPRERGTNAALIIRKIKAPKPGEGHCAACGLPLTTGTTPATAARSVVRLASPGAIQFAAHGDGGPRAEIERIAEGRGAPQTGGSESGRSREASRQRGASSSS